MPPSRRRNCAANRPPRPPPGRTPVPRRHPGARAYGLLTFPPSFRRKPESNLRGETHIPVPKSAIITPTAAPY